MVVKHELYADSYSPRHKTLRPPAHYVPNKEGVSFVFNGYSEKYVYDLRCLHQTYIYFYQ